MRFALILAVCATLSAEQVPRSDAALTIDGAVGDSFWQAISPRALAPSETGVPVNLGGSVWIGVRGNYLCLAARLPEPGGKVVARWSGRNPVWEMDATGSPPVEDRIEFHLGNVIVEINPWGGYRAEDRSILAAANLTTEGWTVEAAVPVELLKSPIAFRAERIRSRRALAPEFRWQSTATLELPTTTAKLSAPEFRPPQLGNSDPPLEVGRVATLPPLVADWDAPEWRNAPQFELPRNEPSPRAARYPTQIRWMHDGRALALLIRVFEPEPVVARNGGRDSAVTSDDHVAVYLATSGSAAIEIAVNTVGAIRDQLIIGPRVMQPQSRWNAGVRTHTNINHGEWIARIDIPLDEYATALGETGVPRDWRILLSRYRAARPGEAEESSTLPAVISSSLHGPMRYRRMTLADAAPAAVKLPDAPSKRGELTSLDAHVWSPMERRAKAVRTMVSRQQRQRATQAILAERRAWEQVKTREDWEKFRDERIRALRESVGKFPPERPPLDARVTARHSGRGYRLENVAYQSRSGYWATGNLYLPEVVKGPAPAMIIVHSQHYPKTQGELHDMGELWARTGSIVLVMERPGYGERVETTPWYRQAYASRFTFTKQLFVAGESYSGWAAWDIIRSVDFLHARSDVDRDRIIVLGSVAGGGEPAGVAAALDPRISAVVPFNYDQGHIRVHGDSPGQIIKQFHPWVVAASVAPRRFVRAFEFGWEGAEEPDYPDLWVDGWARSQKVWGFYGALDKLASSQAYGLIRLSMERVSHCFSIGPQQRAGLHSIFKRWFDIPLPSAEDLSILPDSGLSVSPEREAARRQEAQRRRPHSDLVSIPPSASAGLARKPLHEVARKMASDALEAARARRRNLTPEQRRGQLRDELKPKLGDIDPSSARAQSLWRRSFPAADVEAFSLETEPGIEVPVLLLRPKGRDRTPVVVAVSQGGKDRFDSNRSPELNKLLKAGIAVCLPDVRGTGETSPASDRGDGGPHHSLAQMEFDLGNSMLGARLKDLRSVLTWLRTRPEIDPRKIALWGDSFSPSNPRDLFVDEIQLEGSPQIQYRAEPLGAHLALLGALYEDDVRAVVARGGLSGYLTLLDNAFTYTPIDIVVHGILNVGDISDIAAAAAPRPVLIDGAVNGRNIAVDQRPQSTDIAAWLIARLSE